MIRLLMNDYALTNRNPELQVAKNLFLVHVQRMCAVFHRQGIFIVDETLYTTHPVSCLSYHIIGECYIQQWLTGKCYISHYPNHDLYKTCQMLN